MHSEVEGSGADGINEISEYSVFLLIIFHLPSGGGGELHLTPGGHLLGEVWKQPIWGFWVTLGFSYHLSSVPIIEPSVMQEKARYHRVFSWTVGHGLPGERGCFSEGWAWLSFFVLLVSSSCGITPAQGSSRSCPLPSWAKLAKALPRALIPNLPSPRPFLVGRKGVFHSSQTAPSNPLLPFRAGGHLQLGWRTDPGEGQPLKGQFTCVGGKERFSCSGKARTSTPSLACVGGQRRAPSAGEQVPG